MMEEASMSELRRMLAARVCVILKASREDRDMSQERLAKSLEWTRAMIANLEGGRRAVQFADFVVIARTLNIEPERLLRRVLEW